MLVAPAMEALTMMTVSTEDVTQKPAQEHFDVGIIQYMSHGAP